MQFVMAQNNTEIDFYIRLFLLGLLLAWCFILLRPLMAVTVWAIIIAIALFPLFVWLTARLRGRSTAAAVIITLVALLIVLGPVTIIGQVFLSNVQSFATSVSDGTLTLPSPPSFLTNLPGIGQRWYDTWEQASVDPESLTQFQIPLQSLAQHLLKLAGNLGLTLLQFLLSILIAAVLMLNQESLRGWLLRLCHRITPEYGQSFLQLAAATIRNVTRGIIGVSMLQSLLIGIGLILAGIPAAGLLSILSLFLTIIQIGPALVVIPSLIFAWSTMNLFAAFFFTIWMIPALAIDNILKPILMARGLPVPTIVIFIGVLGGTIVHGLLGLFIGPVILSFGYELLKTWISADDLNRA